MAKVAVVAASAPSTGASNGQRFAGLREEAARFKIVDLPAPRYPRGGRNAEHLVDEEKIAASITLIIGPFLNEITHSYS
jgi:hypothetical protein